MPTAVAQRQVEPLYRARHVQHDAGQHSNARYGAVRLDLRGLGPPQTIFQNVYVRDMANFSFPVYTGTGTAVPGTSASPAMPVNAAIVLTEQITARGRGLKGRIYMAGFATNADAGNGIISTAANTGLSNFCTALYSALTAQSLQPAVAQAPRAAYLGFTGTSHPARGTPGQGHAVGVSSYILRDLVWDTQRRRIQA